MVQKVFHPLTGLAMKRAFIPQILFQRSIASTMSSWRLSIKLKALCLSVDSAQSSWNSSMLQCNTTINCGLLIISCTWIKLRQCIILVIQQSSVPWKWLNFTLRSMSTIHSNKKLVTLRHRILLKTLFLLELPHNSLGDLDMLHHSLTLMTVLLLL